MDPNICFPVFFAPNSTVEHRIFAEQIVSLIDNRAGNPGDVQLRGMLAGSPALSVTAGSLASARRQLVLQTRTALQRRYHVGAEQFTGGGPLIVSDRVIGEFVTGRDQYVASTVTFAGTDAFFITGTRINCPQPLSTIGCDGGVRVEFPPTDTLNQGLSGNSLLFETLYITQSIERTLTGGTTFYEAVLTPLPSGAVHALAAQGALGGGQRFLDRLGDHAALVDRRGLWGDAEGVWQRFAVTGPLAPSAVDSLALRLGYDHAAAPGLLTLGLAGEYVSDDLAIADTIAPETGKLDRWSLGAHVRLERGRFTGSLAAMAGHVKTETSGASVLGAAQADYDATLYGMASRIAVTLGDGPLRAIPEAGASWTGWRRDAFAETGGPAPLSVARARDEQTRLWLGGQLRWLSGAGPYRVALATYGRAVWLGADRTPTITATDPQLPDIPFLTAGPTIGRNRAELGASAVLRLGRGSIAMAWDGSFGSEADTNAVRLTARVPL